MITNEMGVSFQNEKKERLLRRQLAKNLLQRLAFAL